MELLPESYDRSTTRAGTKCPPPPCRIGLNDRVICVPIEDDDVVKTVDSLPRNRNNNGLVWVMYKRQKGEKSYYLSEMIRPDKVYEALKCLI